MDLVYVCLYVMVIANTLSLLIYVFANEDLDTIIDITFTKEI